MDNETMQYIINILESAKQHLLQSEYSNSYTSILTIAKIDNAIFVIKEYQRENEQ